MTTNKQASWLNRTHYGDCRSILSDMVADGVQVQCCVTSPPYFGLRSYLPEGHEDKGLEIGYNDNLDKYIQSMTEVFAHVHVLLAKDGLLFVNISDSMAGSGGSGGDYGKNGRLVGHPKYHPPKVNLPAKNLIGVPWALAFALRDQLGYYLRADMVWAKGVSGQKETGQQIAKACTAAGVALPQIEEILESLDLYVGSSRMESVRDRPSISHEYIFMLSKNPRYYYDFDAVAEPITTESLTRYQRAIDNGEVFNPARHKHTSPEQSQAPMKILLRGCKTMVARKTRNRRSVIQCLPGRFKGQHFASCPEELITPLILAGSRPGDIILDPFMGSGTTAYVAEKLGRNWIGIELNRDYEKLINERIQQPMLKFSG